MMIEQFVIDYFKIFLETLHVLQWKW